MVSDFVLDPDTLFAYLRDKVEWDTRMKVRLTASFGVSYNYSGISYPKVPMLDKLLPLCRKIEKTLGYFPNNCLLNHYQDGHSSMGYHSDSIRELEPGTGVAIISLGSQRTIRYKLKSDNHITYELALPPGSLLYMDDSVQNLWLHSIPKDESAGPRISLTFRNILTQV